MTDPEFVEDLPIWERHTGQLRPPPDTSWLEVETEGWIKSPVLLVTGCVLALLAAIVAMAVVVVNAAT